MKFDRKEVIDVLKKHNAWRRGADIPMLSPTLLGDVIDAAIEMLKEDEKTMEEYSVTSATYYENDWTNVND